MKPEIAIIVAKAEDNGIGCSGGLPWHMPEELKYFKKRTLNKPVIMGRKTFLSLGNGIIGKPLKNRENIVLTTDKNFKQDGIVVKHNLPDAIKHALGTAENDGVDEIMIIGGAQIFEQAKEFADVIYKTQIKHDTFEDTNAKLSSDYFNGWIVVERDTAILHDKKSNLDIKCNFDTLRRI